MTKEENLALCADALKLGIDKRIREETEKIKKNGQSGERD